MNIDAFKRPGFLVGIVSISLFVALKKLEEAIPAAVAAAVGVGFVVGGYGYQLIKKNHGDPKPGSKERTWLGVELIVVAILTAGPFLLLMAAISYLEFLAYWMLALAWFSLFLDRLMEAKLGLPRA